MDKNQTNKTLYLISATIGFMLLMLEVGIYQKTIISLTILLAIIFGGSVISFFTVKNNYTKTYNYKNRLYAFIQCLFSFGFISCYLFMALNYYFAEKDTEIKSFSILSKHTIGTKNPQPAIEINYEGTEKQLVFYTSQQTQVDTSHQVFLQVQKGFFGFDVFNNIILK